MAGTETPELARAAEAGGADLIEIGFPFSDPLADGPVIRRAAERALAAGMRTAACLECLRAIRSEVAVPLVPMTYASLLEAYGWERFDADARDAGAASLIVADLPVDVHPELRRVQLVAPTSTDERIALAAERDGRLALPRHRRRDDGRPQRALARARAARGADAGAHRRTALRGLRHLDSRAGGRRRRARGRRRRRLGGAARRRGRAGGARALRRSASRGARLIDEPVARDAPGVASRRRCARSAPCARGRELARVPGVPRGGRVARRDAHRHRVVAIAVEHELRNAQREPLPRRREHVALEVRGRVAEKRSRRRRRTA